MFFVFVCDLQSNIREDKARNVIFEVMLKSKIFDRLDLSVDCFAIELSKPKTWKTR